MRARVHSIGPLPTVKAWYEISPGTLDQRNIADLKAEFCQILFNAHKPPLTPANIVIELDEFELLDSSSSSVIHENDLLVVKYKATTVAGIKRKREQNEEISTVGKWKNKKRAKSSSSSSSSTSSSSTSDSSSSSSSSSDSSSDSDSDTDAPPSTTLSKATVQKTTTSTHTHPRLSAQTSLSQFPVYPRLRVPKATGHTKEQKRGTLNEQNGTSKEQNGALQKQSSTSFVPPGEGKPSTQQRNQRRRKRRMAEKEGLGRGQEPQQQKDGEQEQETDTIIPSSQSASADLALANFMFHTTKNDNKRRGFKEGKVVIGSRLSHQTFITDISSSSSPLKSSSSPLKSSLPRLIPPSERTDLPGNIIVSSVDVEAGEWDQPRTKAGLIYVDELDGGRMQGKPDRGRKWKAGGEAEFVATQREAPQLSGGGGDDSFAAWDWDEVDRGWEGYPELGTGAVEAGMVLLWKELALHPVSYTPEVMVHAGTVQSATEEGVELKLISRVELDGMEEEEGFEEEGEVVSRKMAELIGYRVYSQ